MCSGQTGYYLILWNLISEILVLLNLLEIHGAGWIS